MGGSLLLPRRMSGEILHINLIRSVMVSQCLALALPWFGLVKIYT